MEALIIENTASTPYINFNYKQRKLVVAGESFPENAVKFYEPVMDWLSKYLMLMNEEQTTEVEFEIIYFNSSTSKIYLTFFSLLDEAAQDGKNIIINWKVAGENETAVECGEEFREDLEFVAFNIVKI